MTDQRDREVSPEAQRLLVACNRDKGGREALAAYIARLEADRDDRDRVDWLEAFVNEDGPLVLHDGSAPTHGYAGLGLRPGALVRTFREAIDAARASSPTPPSRNPNE
jgi:hypothetical protein